MLQSREMASVKSRVGTGQQQPETGGRSPPAKALRPEALIARFRGRLPPSNSDDGHWSDFKRAIYAEFVAAIREVDGAFAQNPHGRAQTLRELRREHHLIVIAERIRRNVEPSGNLSGEELRTAAAYVLDRTDHLAAGGKAAGPRSHLEENMMTSARVNWHKLMRRAGSQAELRGGWGSAASGLRGISRVLNRIRNPALSPEQRGNILLQHVQARLEQLARLAAEVTERPDCALPAKDRALLDELEALGRRMARTDVQ